MAKLTFGKKRRFSGEIFLLYIAWYGFGRAFIELLRTDSLMLGANIRVSSLLSFALCIAAGTLLVVLSKKAASNSSNGEYINVFANNEEEKIETVADNTDEETENYTEEITND